MEQSEKTCMKFERQIKTLSELSWRIRSEIDRMEYIISRKETTDQLRDYLQKDIEQQKNAMMITAEAIELLMQQKGN